MKLSVEQATYKVGNRRILSNVYLSLVMGEVVGLVGRNGCGKTTLLRILFGSLRAEYAQVLLDGRYMTDHERRDVIAMLPQDGFIPERIQVRRAVTLFPVTEHSRISILSDAILSPHIDARVGDLSGGEERYLEILLLLHHPAPFILLDEPFTGLSPLMRDRVSDAVLEMRSMKGIVLSDHDYDNVSIVSDRILYMENGSIAAAKTGDDLRQFGYLPDHLIHS